MREMSCVHGMFRGYPLNVVCYSSNSFKTRCVIWRSVWCSRQIFIFPGESFTALFPVCYDSISPASSSLLIHFLLNVSFYDVIPANDVNIWLNWPPVQRLNNLIFNWGTYDGVTQHFIIYEPLLTDYIDISCRSHRVTFFFFVVGRGLDHGTRRKWWNRRWRICGSWPGRNRGWARAVPVSPSRRRWRLSTASASTSSALSNRRTAAARPSCWCCRHSRPLRPSSTANRSTYRSLRFASDFRTVSITNLNTLKANINFALKM